MNNDNKVHTSTMPAFDLFCSKNL